jgi:hypothetical protein
MASGERIWDARTPDEPFDNPDARGIVLPEDKR